MNRNIGIVTLCALALLALAPLATAADHNVCAPGNGACVVQQDSAYADPDCNGQPYRYGLNEDQNSARIDAAGVKLAAVARNGCQNWHYADYDYQGVYVTGSAGGQNANVVWQRGVNDYHWPGAPKDYRYERLDATVSDGSGRTGVTWQHVVTEGSTAETCDTALHVKGASTSYGCPAGGPPAPPNLPWGRILP